MEGGRDMGEGRERARVRVCVNETEREGRRETRE